MDTSSQPSGNEERLARQVLAFSVYEPHPEPRKLASYHSGELSDVEADVIQDHLVACEYCSALVLDLEELMGDEAPAPGAQVQPLASTPRPLGPLRVSGSDPAHAAVSSRSRRPVLARRLGQSPGWRIAAGLILSVSIFQAGRWTVEWSSVEKGKRPQAVASERTLLASGSLRSGTAAGPVEEIRLPAYLSFRFPSEAIGFAVAFEFMDQAGRSVWKVDGGRVRTDNEVRVVLPMDCLKPGLYVVRATLLEAPPGGGQPKYRFRVLSP